MKVFYKNLLMTVFILGFFYFLISLTSISAYAFIFESFKKIITNKDYVSASSQNIDENLLKPNIYQSKMTNSQNIDSSASALNVDSGSMRVSTEEEKNITDTISIYEIKEGDTIESVAKLFNVSPKTIIYANELKSKTLKVGEVLLIFPITGIQYTVKNSGTIEDIAKIYKTSAEEVALYNGISKDRKLAKGDIIFIPDVESEIVETSTSKKPKPKYATNATAGYFMRPVKGCVKTQGIHGHNAVDLGCKVGTSLLASADGKVIAAKFSGYNGGYGQVIIISHPNGTQTVYGHLSSILVSTGETVKQGQIIGATGNSGRSTGPHLHFEIRGAANPF